MKILVVEDDSVSALVLRKALEKLGHDPMMTGDGETAWQTLVGGAGRAAGGASPFRIIISDWMMPLVDGVELCRRVRSRSDLGYVYFILLTARGSADDKREAMEGGVDDFLVKPLDAGELLARLEVAKRTLALMEDVSHRSTQVVHLQNQLKRSEAPLGNLLLQQGTITAEQLKQIQDQQARTGKSLSALLVANGWITEEQLTQAHASQIDMPYIAIATAPVDLFTLTLIDKEIAQKYLVLPLAEKTDDSNDSWNDLSPLSGASSGPLRLAVADPWNIEAIDLVQHLTRRRVEPVLANAAALQTAIERVYHDSGADSQKLLVAATLEQAADMGYDDPDTLTAGEIIKESDQAPIIRLLNQILNEGVRRRASDIHIEPYEKDFEIRYRIDGELHVIQTLPRPLLSPLLSRIKVMADLDITERRLPQDGRISTTLDSRRLDFRISTMPMQFGERAVFRILDRASASLSLDQLSFSPRNRDAFEGMIRHPHGIILVTGPTGSGKTTTLYATLNALKSSSTNIMTCEDPIEYQLDRIGQSAVNEKAGLTFASQLRALMRQDPDIILVGEIRDAETAETAFRAALTGHLVFSTLHCNEAAGAPTRLLDMGVPGFLVSSALLGVIAQRLVRRLCPHCRQEYYPDAEKRAVIETMTGMPFGNDPLYEAVGCAQCDDMGLRGRLGAHEVLVVNDRIRALCMKDSDTAAYRAAALEAGMVPLVRDGLEKARQGLTTFEEVQRKLIAA